MGEPVCRGHIAAASFAHKHMCCATDRKQLSEVYFKNYESWLFFLRVCSNKSRAVALCSCSVAHVCMRFFPLNGVNYYVQVRNHVKHNQVPLTGRP